jgi:hypothetical protein
MNRNFHKHISDYLDGQRKDYITDDYAFTSYHAPNTTYVVSNDLDDILIELPLKALRTWYRTMRLLKRNHDPVLACTVVMKYEHYKDLMSRKSFYESKALLLEAQLLIKTAKPSIMIVNVRYASKLYKPKFEFP